MSKKDWVELIFSLWIVLCFIVVPAVCLFIHTKRDKEIEKWFNKKDL